MNLKKLIFVLILLAIQFFTSLSTTKIESKDKLIILEALTKNKLYDIDSNFEPSDWKLDEICVNGQNCYLKQPFSMKKINLHKFGQISLLQSIDCPCIGDYKYECGVDGEYCTSNQNACDELMYLLKANNKKSIDKLKSCNNSNLTIKTNLFNFKLRF
jgi:hypothetical protein